jgi:AcrR family transcriptional regulator
VSAPDRADRADRRRTALLAALDELLREHPLDAIKIADISHRAGVTRSAFYFDSKAIAVAALMSEVYDERFVATTLLRAEDETPQARIDAGLRAMFEVVTERAHLHRALGDARNTDPTVRALWDADRGGFVGPVVELIEAERAAGRAPEGPDPTALATLLLELNDRVLERVARGSELDVRPQLDAVIAIWLRSIYGSGGTA